MINGRAWRRQRWARQTDGLTQGKTTSYKCAYVICKRYIHAFTEMSVHVQTQTHTLRFSTTFCNRTSKFCDGEVQPIIALAKVLEGLPTMLSYFDGQFLWEEPSTAAGIGGLEKNNNV